jgi:hypothetical protein
MSTATIGTSARAANAIVILTLIRISAREQLAPARALLRLRRRSVKPGALVPIGDKACHRRLATAQEVVTMKHPSTRVVFEYWNKRRGTRPAPERSDIDPTEIRHALGDTFMLAVDFVDQLRFRLAGTRVCALFCREVKGEAFLDIWSEGSRKAIGELLAILKEENVGAVAGLTGHTEEGDLAELEMLLLPLAHSGLARIRALGVLAPATPPYWLGARPIGEFALATLRHIGPEVKMRALPRFGRGESRRRHGFVVYSGGRQTSPEERTG